MKKGREGVQKKNTDLPSGGLGEKRPPQPPGKPIKEQRKPGTHEAGGGQCYVCQNEMAGVKR